MFLPYRIQNMGSKYVTISVKVPREIKKKLEKARTSPSMVMKKALDGKGNRTERLGERD